MRKILIALLAAAGLAVAAVGASSAALPASAHAAGCSQWSLASTNRLIQQNGWDVEVDFWQGRWQAWSWPHDGMPYSVHGTVYGPTFSSTNQVTFTIDWSNGSSGVYTATIWAGGFVDGWSVDRFHRQNRTYWYDLNHATCLR
jgi:hypothetical protein